MTGNSTNRTCGYEPPTRWKTSDNPAQLRPLGVARTLPRPMKAQRRHELQENELAKVIKRAPSFWQQSGGKILALLIAVLVIALLIQFRRSSNREAHAQAIEGLSNARALIDELKASALMIGMEPAEPAGLRRKQYFNDATNIIGEVTRLTDDRQLTAEALLARGDLNWAAATLPELPGSATQPALQFNRKESLDSAAEAYRTVVDNYGDIKQAAVAARLSLGAIAEERGQWDEAKAIYEKVAAEAKDQPAYAELARARLQILEQLRNPVILATPSTLPAIPPLVAAPTTATMPMGAATTAPAAPPAAPTTASAGAATQPAVAQPPPPPAPPAPTAAPAAAPATTAPAAAATQPR